MTHELYKTKEEIEYWLKKYQIINYHLIEDTEYGYVVNVDSNVELYDKNIKEIKVKFNIINGTFNCSKNKLKTLIGAPNKVMRTFRCSYNEITLLKGCPEIINENFDCCSNQLTSLKFSPISVGKNFDCSYNKIITLEHVSKIIHGYFDCSNNKLTNLNHCPEEIKNDFYCDTNQLENLNYFPKKVKGLCKIYNNEKLGSIQKLELFEDLKKIHDILILNENIGKKLVIDNIVKKDKIKI